MRRSRQERSSRYSATASVARNVSHPVSNFRYRQFTTTPPSVFTWTASLVPSSLNLSFTPTTALQGLFDRYKVTEVIVKLYYASSTANYGFPFVVCYDASRDASAALTSPAAVERYSDSKLVALTQTNPCFEYRIRNPQNNVVGSTGTIMSRDPVPTEEPWTAGTFYIAPFFYTAVNSAVGYSLQFVVEYSEPRSEV